MPNLSKKAYYHGFSGKIVIIYRRYHRYNFCITNELRASGITVLCSDQKIIKRSSPKNQH